MLGTVGGSMVSFVQRWLEMQHEAGEKERLGASHRGRHVTATTVGETLHGFDGGQSG
jgi:hypothetical protein